MNEHKTAVTPDSQRPSLMACPPDIVIATDTHEAHRVQEIIVERLAACGFSERDIFGIKLALEEALVNAMKHGNRMDQTKKVEITFRVEGNAFLVCIADEGRGFNPEDVPDPTLDENLERPCGRGLMLMRYYMDQVQFLQRGNVVLMSKCCSADCAESARNGSH